MERVNLKSKDIILDYNRIYSGPGIRANSAYYRWLARLFNLRQAAMLLDVSCGEGIFLKEALKLSKLKAFGLDISDKAISIAKHNALGSSLVVADGQRVPFKDKSFDYLTCLGSLEHYIDQELGLKEMQRVAKDDATFYILLPNSLSINLFFHVIKYGDKPSEDFQIIERTATRNEWVLFLEKNGLKVIKVYGSNLWPEFFKEGTRKVKSVPKYFERLLIKLFCPLNLSMDFIFVCKKSLSAASGEIN